MSTKSKRAVASLLNSPLHAIVGLDLLVTGLILLTHRHYFFWPPRPSWITAAENDILIGLIGVVAGLGMIYWAISPEKSISLNRKLIPTATAYFTLLAVTEIMHGVFSPLGTPHMFTSGLSELIMTLVTLHMARNSPTRN